MPNTKAKHNPEAGREPSFGKEEVTRAGGSAREQEKMETEKRELRELVTISTWMMGYDSVGKEKLNPQSKKWEEIDVVKKGDQVLIESHINEDKALFRRDSGHFVVCDGVGGAAGGELASMHSAEYIISQLENRYPDHLTHPRPDNPELVLTGNLSLFETPRETQTKLEKILTDANKEIHDMQVDWKAAHPASADEESSMGTTVVTLALREDTPEAYAAVIGWAGDSRVYKFSKGKLERITTDDSALEYLNDTYKLVLDDQEVQQSVDIPGRKAKLTVGDVRHGVTQYLGTKSLTPHTRIVPARAGELFIMLTDGVTDNLTEKEMQEIAEKEHDPATLAKELTFAARVRARSRGTTDPHPRAKPDDMTALVIMVEGTPKKFRTRELLILNEDLDFAERRQEDFDEYLLKRTSHFYEQRVALEQSYERTVEAGTPNPILKRELDHVLEQLEIVSERQKSLSRKKRGRSKTPREAAE